MIYCLFSFQTEWMFTMKLMRLIILLEVSFVLAVHLKNYKLNRIITVALSERIPFVIFDRNGTPNGLDILIIENFGRKFNLQIDYLVVNSSLNQVLMTKQDWSSFSIGSHLISKADIIIGGLDGNIRNNEHFTASRSYFHDKLTWCVQKKQKIPSWKNIFHLCNDPIVWILHTAMSCSVVFTMYYLQRFEDLHPKWDWAKITLITMGILLGIPCKYRPIKLPLKMFYVFGIFGSILYVIVLLSFVIMNLKSSFYEDNVESTKKILDASFEIIGDSFSLQHMMKKNEVCSIAHSTTFSQ